MACDAPLSIRYDPPKPDGKGGFIYNFPGDCGKCLMCLKKRKAQWSFRIMEEKRNSFSSYFVTLTYKDEFLIYGDDGPTGSTGEHQEFIKWLKYYEDKRRLDKREAISVQELARVQNNSSTIHKKLRYFGVLEYGDDKKTQRPHYHYLLFNVHDTDSIRDAWSEQVRNGSQDPTNQYKPGRSKGRIQIDECNVNTVDYVLKYMIKLRKDDEEWENKAKEKSYMSKGIGQSVADPEFIRYIKQPSGNQVVNTRGHKVPLPRYYSKKYLNDDERGQKGLYIASEIAAQEAKEEAFYKSNAVDIYKAKQLQKESRFNQIKNRKQREIRDSNTRSE